MIAKKPPRPETQRAIGLGLGVFSVVSTLAQVVLLPRDLQVITYGLTAAAVIGAFIMLRSSGSQKYRLALKSLGTSSTTQPSAHDPTVEHGPLRSEWEARELWREDAATFEGHAVPPEVGITWWTRYRDGIYALRRDDKIVGYISLWPITARTFKRLITGELREDRLTSRCILRRAEQGEQSWWYLGSISVAPKLRRTSATKELVANALEHWLGALPGTATINICALAYSQEGARLLRRFGFNVYESADTSPHGLAVCVHQSEVNGLLKKVKLRLGVGARA